MEQGTYTGRRVDFVRYAASAFNPHLFAGEFRRGRGCGATALALLTGVPPELIAAKNGPGHFADDFLIRFLRRRGFSVRQLTQCNLSATPDHIREHHVVLISQLFRRNEGTWGVLYLGNYYHNFDIFTVEALSLLNKPILSAYLVVHPRWRLHQLSSKTPKAKTRPKCSGLRWGDLLVGEESHARCGSSVSR